MSVCPAKRPTSVTCRPQRSECSAISAMRSSASRRGGAFRMSAVFGSVARGDARPQSDVDLLVDFDPGHHGLDLFGFEREVEELIGYRVEVGTEVRRSIREKVHVQAMPL